MSEENILQGMEKKWTRAEFFIFFVANYQLNAYLRTLY
jgi:hypothetical protein